MNLKQLILDLKAAVQAGKWFDVARLTGKLLEAGADLAELVIGVAAAEDVSSELADLEATCAAVTVTADDTKAIDPATIIQLVFLVIDLIRQARRKK